MDKINILTEKCVRRKEFLPIIDTMTRCYDLILYLADGETFVHERRPVLGGTDSRAHDTGICATAKTAVKLDSRRTTER
jgi:hypothetical protein